MTIGLVRRTHIVKSVKVKLPTRKKPDNYSSNDGVYISFEMGGLSLTGSWCGFVVVSFAITFFRVTGKLHVWINLIEWVARWLVTMRLGRHPSVSYPRVAMGMPH